MYITDKTILKINGFNYIGSYLKGWLYKIITRKSLNVFVRSIDSIAISPQVNGNYDPALINVIDQFCLSGYSDFFIDIGANIGMVSCQVQNRFKVVHMFEPNKLCSKVLEVNAQLNSISNNYVVHEYGLASVNKEAILKIPKRNWGGAFIQDEDNSYRPELLAKKECVSSFIDSDFISLPIELKKASDILGQIFNDLDKLKMNNGIIKLDVEGYEDSILKEIATCLPTKLNIVIIFESWSGDIPVHQIFRDIISYQKITRSPPWQERWPKLVKLLLLGCGLPVKYNLETVWNKAPGDYVIRIGSHID